MKGKVLGIIFVAALALVGRGVGVLNTIKNLDISIDGAWADVEVQYQRRADLIKNLVKTVQGFADHELKVFTEVTDLRTKATSITVNLDDPKTLEQFAQAQSALTQ